MEDFLKRHKVAVAVVLTAILFGPHAIAQAWSYLVGSDSTGVTHTVLTDTSGRLIVALSGTSANIETLPAQCATSTPQNTVSVDTTAGGTAVPTTQTANRQYVNICNSKVNLSGLIKCRVDGSAPVYATGAGDVLDVGDCISYAVASSITPKCIANAGTLTVTTFECVP